MLEAREDVLAFRHFPDQHWRRVWSTNLLERVNEEIKRRTRVVGIFPNDAAITGLVNDAANNSSSVIVVPNTSYELNYGSVEGVGSYGASFNYNVDGSTLMGAANCQQGLLNGQVPGTSDQAQLLNAVCQVAYGSGN